MQVKPPALKLDSKSLTSTDMTVAEKMEVVEAMLMEATDDINRSTPQRRVKDYLTQCRKVLSLVQRRLALDVTVFPFTCIHLRRAVDSAYSLSLKGDYKTKAEILDKTQHYVNVIYDLSGVLAAKHLARFNAFNNSEDEY